MTPRRLLNPRSSASEADPGNAPFFTALQRASPGHGAHSISPVRSSEISRAFPLQATVRVYRDQPAPSSFTQTHPLRQALHRLTRSTVSRFQTDRLRPGLHRPTRSDSLRRVRVRHALLSRSYLLTGGTRARCLTLTHFLSHRYILTHRYTHSHATDLKQNSLTSLYGCL